jgi:hypothetical protein
MRLARIADRLETQSMLVIECTIPPDATIAEWRRSSSTIRAARRSRARRVRELWRRAMYPT